MSKWHTLEQKEPINGNIYYVYVKELEKPELMCYLAKERGFFQIFHPAYILVDATKVIAWMDSPDAPLESEITDRTEFPV